MTTPPTTQTSKPTTLKPTRRELLGLSTAAAGAWATSAWKSAIAADGPEQVRTAVIGTGGRGSDLIRSLTTIEGCELVALADDYPPHLEKASKFAGPQAKLYSDYRKLLEEVKPAAVVVAVPLYLHYQVAGDAIAAGVDVFCEKTMCYTVDEAQKLADQVAAAKRVFQVGLQRRANPIYQQAAAMVQAGVLGQITAVKAQWHRNNNWRRPIPVAKGDADWSRLERKLNWRLYRDYSGGLMTELGSHQLDVVNWMFGDIPRKVTATGGVDYWRDGREVCDNVFCIYEYELPPTAGPRPDANAAATSTGGTPESSLKPYTVRATYSSLCKRPTAAARTPRS